MGDASDSISDINYLPELLFRFFGWYEWQALKRSDAAVFVSESSYQQAIDHGIDDAVKLPNAVNYELFADPDSESITEAQSILEAESVDMTARS